MLLKAASGRLFFAIQAKNLAHIAAFFSKFVSILWKRNFTHTLRLLSMRGVK